MERTVSNLASASIGEWKSDEIRLLRGGINDVKDLLKTYLSGERPLDRAERILAGGPQGGMQPSQMAGEAERGGVIKELRKHGLVTRIVERGSPRSGSSSNSGPLIFKESRIISAQPKEPVRETEPLRGKKGTNTYTQDNPRCSYIVSATHI